jgi:hypothetical protein
MADAIGGGSIAGLFALDFEKACDLTHDVPLVML